jgi:hypothetical protein
MTGFLSGHVTDESPEFGRAFERMRAAHLILVGSVQLSTGFDPQPPCQSCASGNCCGITIRGAETLSSVGRRGVIRMAEG